MKKRVNLDQDPSSEFPDKLVKWPKQMQQDWLDREGDTPENRALFEKLYGYELEV
jgi:hypothetical protein